MHHGRIAAFLLGCWIAGSLFMALVATQNFGIADRVLNSPPPQVSKMIDTLGHENARQLFRHLAGEENRLYFYNWETVQLALGVVLTGFLLFGLDHRLLASLAGALLVLTLFEHFKVTTEMLWLGRSIDFVPRAAESGARSQFGKLHALYGVIEVLKLLLAVAIAVFLFPLQRRRVRSKVEVKPVDYADHRHINR